MNRPQVWMDSETGGFDPNVHSALEAAFLAVKDGVIVDELVMTLRIDPIIVTQEALTINKIDLTTPGIKTYDEAKSIYTAWMNKNFFTKTVEGAPPRIEKPSKETMPLFCGQNTFFDRRFLHAILQSTYDMCYYHRIDTMVLGEVMREMGLLPGIADLKLPTMCNYFGNTEDGFHGALFDIRKTFWLYGKMKAMLMNAGVSTALAR